jgi:KDO2-lipid IV(A) lauroyltransferase
MPPALRALRIRLEAAIVAALRGATALLPLRWVSVPGAGMGWALYAVLRLSRRTTLDNLAIAFGDRLGAPERERLARACYRFFGAVIWEFLNAPRIPRARIGEFITLENPEVVERALARGRGVVLVSGHLGHWELMAAGLAARGFPITMYVGGQGNALVDAAINAIRRALGSRTVGRGATRGIFKALRAGGLVALLADQHESSRRQHVAFFGRPVSAVSGPFHMARRSGAALLFGACLREGRFRYRARFQELTPPPPSGDEQRDLLAVTQLLFTALEAVVRSHPEQYFWMHRRFRLVTAAELTETNRAFLAAQGVHAAP